MIEPFFVSTGGVSLCEMGDKTQLLAIVLAARFGKPVHIIFCILVPTLANHAAAGAAGSWVARVLGAAVLRWALDLSFLAMAVWMLIPDKIDDQATRLVRCIPYTGMGIYLSQAAPVRRFAQV